MHNWVEFEYHSKERMADALRWAENERRVQAVRRRAGARRRETARRARMGREPRPATLVLGRGELLTLRVGRRGLVLTCVAGRIWATTNRVSADVVLLPGQTAEFADRGTVVIEALRTATIRIDCLRQAHAIFPLLPNALARPRIALFL